MKTHTLKITSLFVIAMLLLSACGAQSNTNSSNSATSSGLFANVIAQAEKFAQSVAQEEIQPTAQPTTVPQISDATNLLAAYEGTLTNVYAQVNPSVVNIRVVQKQSGTILDQSGYPFGFDTPENSEPQIPQFSEGLGSGFVWDTQGHIVTNNHVVESADKIEVTFEDGTILPATLVGSDSYSDLAVIKVEGTPELLHPVKLADSKQVKVGEIAIAIGNPFGLEGTMTVGIISALGRTLSTGSSTTSGATYSIPNIIQTDAPINPGNSGGVLVDEQGRVIGVTYAIESTDASNSGIGFAIPSAIVGKVVPSLIETGKYDHPYLGISGTSLTPDVAEAMSLNTDQRGVLVVTVTEDGPAAKAGLRPSQDTITIDGQELPTGGDIITAINNQDLKNMDDLIAYLNDETEVGQIVTLTVLREGKETTLDVTLGARPAATSSPEILRNVPEDQSPIPRTSSNAWLGILGAQLTPEIANAMNLDEEQQGILIVQVEIDSPAEEARLRGSDQEVTVDGQTIQIGGDIITAVDGKTVSSLDELRSLIRTYQPGTDVKLTILRDGNRLEISATLAERPENIP